MTAEPTPIRTATDDRPEIRVTTAIAEVTDRALDSLADDSEIYARRGEIVRVVGADVDEDARIRIEAGTPVIALASTTWLRERLSIASRWQKYDGRRGEWVPCLPPPWVPDTMAERRAYDFRELVGVIEAPTLRLDGTVLQRPGYDAETRLYYAPSRDYPAVLDKPTLADAQAAAARVLDPLREFPYVAPFDRSAVLALVLTCAARSAIDDPVPMWAVRAHVPGTGKSKLAEASMFIGLGRRPPRCMATADEAETRKVLFARALAGSQGVLVDNANGPFGSATWSMVTTATEISDRVLGESREATVPWRAVVVTNGNNTTFLGDLGRRVIPIDLDAGVESPEDRTFAIADLEGYVAERCGALHTDALTILRAFHVAGRPQHSASRMGSFEVWDRLIRSAVIWLGWADPCEGRARISEVDDEDKGRIRALLLGLHEAVGTEAWTVSELAARAGDKLASGGWRHEALREAVMALDPRSDGERIHPGRTGIALRSMVGRPVAGLRLERVNKAHRGVVCWRIAEAPQ
jgi:hypothetical protein